MREISKAFQGIPVLDRIHFECHGGEVHAICGENGAGKSTLMKILSGVHQPDLGEIRLGGQPIRFSHPVQGRRAGISVIHQELSLLPHRSVADNIFLGEEQRRGPFINRAGMMRDAQRLLDRLGSRISPQVVVRDLSIAEQQVVEIAKALAIQAKILVLDEPTAPLDTVESAKLFKVIDDLRRSGVAIIYISHRMREVFELADRITVLKDGRRMASVPAGEISPDEVIRLMVGRPISDFFPPRASAPVDGVTLAIRNGGNGALSGINLDLHAGEIVGIAGLDGAGKTELAKAIFGEAPFTTGTIRFWDGRGAVTNPRAGARRGLAYLPDDRKAEGLGLRQSLRDNAALVLRGLASGLAGPGFGTRSTAKLDSLLSRVEVRAASYDAPVETLSGGNQQKVIVARWIAADPRLWIVAEPTRGIDVGAKATIYRILREHAQAGGTVLMVSSDLTEIIGLSDRILVMAGGTIVKELPAGASEEEILAHAVHHAVNAPAQEAMQ